MSLYLIFFCEDKLNNKNVNDHAASINVFEKIQISLKHVCNKMCYPISIKLIRNSEAIMWLDSHFKVRILLFEL